MSLVRRNLWVLVAVLSVALNLFFVGAVVARYMNRPERPPEPPSMRWLMRDLDPVTREQLRPLMEGFSEGLRPLRREMFQVQRQVNQLLAAPELDSDAAATAFRTLREANLKYQELSHQQLVQVFAQLSSEQRESAVRFMSERSSPENRAQNRPAAN